MKKILVALMISMAFTACSFLSRGSGVDLEKKYSLNKEAAVKWEKTMINVLTSEAKISEWYGNENPLLNLRRQGKLTEKDLYFLEELGKLNANQVTDDDYEKFLDMLGIYVESLPRRFFLENTNLKDPKGLAKYMVKSSYSQIDNPSKYIKEEVAEEHEWAKIEELANKDDLSKRDVKKLRKILNAFIKRDNFFNKDVWYKKEVSNRVMELVEISKIPSKDKIELNNLNAKALYIAYSEYFSKLEKWSK